MGTWGFGPFENDDAIEFLEDLQHPRSLQTLKKAVSGITRKRVEFCDSRDLFRTVAAAEVIALLCGQGSQSPSDHASEALSGVKVKISNGLIDEAMKAIELLTKFGEADQLFSIHARGRISPWRLANEDLMDRLGGARTLMPTGRNMPPTKHSNKIHTRSGDLFIVHLRDGTISFGMAIIGHHCVFFDHQTDVFKGDIDPVGHSPILFRCLVSARPFSTGHWAIVGHSQIKHNDWFPLRYRRVANGPRGPEHWIYSESRDGTWESKEATDKECEGLEELVSWSEEHISEKILRMYKDKIARR